MANTFLKVIDQGLRSVIWTKFYEYMGFGSGDVLADNIVLYPKHLAQRKIAEKRGRQRSEFISLWRLYTKFSWERQRTPIARRGMHLIHQDTSASDLKTSIVTAKAVPVDLEYEVHYWSKDLDMLNDVDEEYLFWIHSNPNLNLLFDDTYSMQMDLHFDEIIDESDLEVYEKGQYFVHRHVIRIEGWIPALYSTKTIKKIIITFWDRDEIDDTSEFLLEPDDNLKLFTKTIEE